MRFRDRADAGRELARRLLDLRLVTPVVLGLPRGGIPVAAEVAGALGVPLEAFVARKIGAPGHEERGVGEVAEGLQEPVMSAAARRLGITSHEWQILSDRAQAELQRRVAVYRRGRPLPVM